MKGPCIVVASVLALAGASGSLLAAEAAPVVGEVAPAFSLTSLAGDRVSLSDYRGKIVVLHFGAGW